MSLPEVHELVDINHKPHPPLIRYNIPHLPLICYKRPHPPPTWYKKPHPPLICYKNPTHHSFDTTDHTHHLYVTTHHLYVTTDHTPIPLFTCLQHHSRVKRTPLEALGDLKGYIEVLAILTERNSGFVKINVAANDISFTKPLQKESKRLK